MRIVVMDGGHAQLDSKDKLLLESLDFDHEIAWRVGTTEELQTAMNDQRQIILFSGEEALLVSELFANDRMWNVVTMTVNFTYYLREV